jgi:hypothetical protein
MFNSFKTVTELTSINFTHKDYTALSSGLVLRIDTAVSEIRLPDEPIGSCQIGEFGEFWNDFKTRPEEFLGQPEPEQEYIVTLLIGGEVFDQKIVKELNYWEFLLHLTEEKDFKYWIVNTKSYLDRHDSMEVRYAIDGFGDILEHGFGSKAIYDQEYFGGFNVQEWNNFWEEEAFLIENNEYPDWFYNKYCKNKERIQQLLKYQYIQEFKYSYAHYLNSYRATVEFAIDSNYKVVLIKEQAQ